MSRTLSKIEEGSCESAITSTSISFTSSKLTSSHEIVHLIQKVIGEMIGTYMVIFGGCGSVVVNKIHGSITFPGICVVWGLVVMVMTFSIGHISGAHFNPAVTFTFAIFNHFPLKHVPLYIMAQILGAFLASETLCLVFQVTEDSYFGTVPIGSEIQSLVIEIIISFLLMFVFSGVATDHRAIGQLAGIAIGMTTLLNVFVAGAVSGGSMNPARSIGPAMVRKKLEGLWIYIAGPITGTVLGGGTYKLITFTHTPLPHISATSSFFTSMSPSFNR